jgi:hypothetical protein
MINATRRMSRTSAIVMWDKALIILVNISLPLSFPGRFFRSPAENCFGDRDGPLNGLEVMDAEERNSPQKAYDGRGDRALQSLLGPKVQDISDK